MLPLFACVCEQVCSSRRRSSESRPSPSPAVAVRLPSLLVMTLSTPLLVMVAALSTGEGKSSYAVTR